MCQLNGDLDDMELRKRFTAYLSSAIRNRKATLARNKISQWNYETSIEFDENDISVKGNMPTEDSTFDVVSAKIAFESVMGQASKRDQYIFYSHVMDNRGFGDLGEELGLSYKGVAAIYYRLLRKMNAERGGDDT